MEVVLLLPKGSRVIKEHPGSSWFSHSEIVKLFYTRWLSHEHCVKALCKELPPLLQTLSQLHESPGDAEAYGIYSLLAIVNGVSSSYLISEVLSSLALLNLFM